MRQVPSSWSGSSAKDGDGVVADEAQLTQLPVAAQVERGRLDFELFGVKLRGAFTQNPFAKEEKKLNVAITYAGNQDLLDGGDVHPLVERAGLHPAFANACEPDKILFAAPPFGHERTVRNRNHRAEVTDHRQLIFAWPATMNVSVPSAHRPESRAEISARNINQRFAERGPPGLIANERREDIVLFQE